MVNPQRLDQIAASEKPKDECGVFGLYRHPEAATITYFGLYALQHRGQESAGISVNREKDDKIFSHKGMGLVPEIFNMEDLDRIEGLEKRIESLEAKHSG